MVLPLRAQRNGEEHVVAVAIYEHDPVVDNCDWPSQAGLFNFGEVHRPYGLVEDGWVALGAQLACEDMDSGWKWEAGAASRSANYGIVAGPCWRSFAVRDELDSLIGKFGLKRLGCRRGVTSRRARRADDGYRDDEGT